MRQKNISDHLYPLHALDEEGSIAAIISNQEQPLRRDEASSSNATQWALWRWMAVRGAGFPVELVLPLAVSESIALAEQLLQAEDDVKVARKAVWSFLYRSRHTLDKKQYTALSTMMRTIKDRQLYQVQVPLVGDSEELTRLYAASQRLAVLHAEFQQAYTEATQRVSRYLQTIARSDRFREAITWQNRQALHGSIAALLQIPSDTTSHIAKQRKHELLVASYLQRYCTKNDTIGFFGPVGWAQVMEIEAAISVLPGQNLLATRNVFFEGWGIDALLKVLASDPALRPWLIPRRLPHIYVVQNQLFVPFTNPIRLTDAQAAILLACDGRRTAQELAHSILQSSSVGLRNVEDIYAILEHLSVTRRIVWTWEISLDDVYPERSCRQLLERIDNMALRQACLEKLARLEQGRASLASAAGHAGLLDQAFAYLEATFTDVTSRAPNRSAGQIYAARTLVYEDCRRDLQMIVGPRIIQDLEKPLQLLLQSARWLTYYMAALYRKALMEIYINLVQKTHTRTIPFPEFWLWSQSLLVGGEAEVIKPLIQAFQRRWSSILHLSQEQHHLEYGNSELRASVMRNFQAPRPGWNSACYHSPDILLAAHSVKGICAGEYEFVLGEMHVALNTLQASAFREQHPEPDAFLRFTQCDLPAPRVFPVPSHAFLPITRTRPSLILPKDYALLFAADACAPIGGQMLPISSLVVEQVGNHLLVRTHDQHLQFDIIEVFAEFLSEIASHLFTIVPVDKHIPRVSIDRLVLLRETWVFDPASLQFARTLDPQERFLSARRWIREHQIPRFCFVKTPIEQKPCFVDFESAIYIDLLARLARRTREMGSPDARITITEMLPSPERSWLPDHEGACYTSELRIVAIDCATT